MTCGPRQVPGLAAQGRVPTPGSSPSLAFVAEVMMGPFPYQEPRAGRQASMIDISSTERTITEMQKEKRKIPSVQSSANGCIELDHIASFGATDDVPDFG